MLKIATTVGSEPEADLVCARLLEAGIHAMPQRSMGGAQWGSGGASDVYVEEQDLDRAREVLNGDEGVSEEELERLSAEETPPSQGA